MPCPYRRLIVGKRHCRFLMVHRQEEDLFTSYKAISKLLKCLSIDMSRQHQTLFNSTKDYLDHFFARWILGGGRHT